jgi:NTP pyrophosphatase (non-canonical NTP hydrolase)
MLRIHQKKSLRFIVCLERIFMRDLKQVMGVLTEECAEVIQAISKINRFGLDSEWQGVTNKQALITEIGDVLALVKVLKEDTDINISDEEIQVAIDAKLEKLKIFLPHI